MPSRMIPLNQIVVEDRQREDLGDIQELADSINNPLFGLLNPIVVEERDSKYYLRAGGRRLAAHAVLGRTEIEAMVRGEMTELEAQMVELEENIRRKNLDWDEEAKAVDKIHKLKMATEKDWTAAKTAELVGKSRRMVYNFVEVAKGLESTPDISKADGVVSALNRLKQAKQIKQRQLDVELRRVQVERGKKPNLFWHVHQGDCVPYMRDMADGCMDMILTDPPWSVNYDDLLIGEQKSFDDSIYVLPKVRDAAREWYRLLRDERFCVMYWPTNETELPKDILKELGAPPNTTLHDVGRWFLSSVGFRVHPRPLIWYKPNKRFGSVQDPSRQITSQYETILLAFKGDARFFKRPGSDVFVGDVPGPDRLHPNEKNLEISEILIDIFTVPGENVLDPFAGGGVHGEAALRQERNAHLVELDVEFAERCSTRLESTVQKKQSGEIPELGQPATDIPKPTSGSDVPLAGGGVGAVQDGLVLPSPNRAIIAQFENSEPFDNHIFDPE